MTCVVTKTQYLWCVTGCGSAWLERLVWDQEVAGSNPVTPSMCGCSSMVEHQPSKLDTWVRFPSPASQNILRQFHIFNMICVRSSAG